MPHATTLTEPRIRFNSGFWDGYAGAWRGRSIVGHFDLVYAAGVQYGETFHAAGTHTDTSTPAWDAYRQAVADRAAARRAARLARPSAYVRRV